MSNYKFETLQIHAGQETPDPATGSRAVPIYQTTAYVFPSSETAAERYALKADGNIYTRLTNPTNDVFEQRIAALEGGVAALSFASGSAAVAAAVLNITRVGDHIVSDKYIYGGTSSFFVNTLADMGIECTFVDAFNLAEVEAAIRPNTKLVYAESLSNPGSTIVDMEEIAKIAHKNGIPLLIDNTFPTPFLLRPFEYGADVVIHSASKFIGGHGTTLGGVIVDGGNFNWSQNDKFACLSKPNPSYNNVTFTEIGGAAAYALKARATLLLNTGATLAPLHSFLFLQGLETLSLRVERHTENALQVVDYLQAHPKVKSVNHPAVATRRDNALYKKYYPNGAGSIFTFDVVGTRAQAQAFSEALQLFSLLANVADVKSLVIHPASTTHSSLSAEELAATGIYETTIRLSIGTEHIDDIIADLEQAFESVR